MLQVDQGKAVQDRVDQGKADQGMVALELGMGGQGKVVLGMVVLGNLA